MDEDRGVVRFSGNDAGLSNDVFFGAFPLRRYVTSSHFCSDYFEDGVIFKRMTPSCGGVATMAVKPLRLMTLPDELRRKLPNDYARGHRIGSRDIPEY